MRVLLCVIVLILPVPAYAQPPHPLVGTWERTSLKGARGATVQPPAPPAFLIMTADGFFVQIAIPAGRPRLNKRAREMTRDELLTRFDDVNGRRGTWSVAGDRLTRMTVSAIDPDTEGTREVRRFRIDGNVLILTSPDPADRVEARFQRLIGPARPGPQAEGHARRPRRNAVYHPLAVSLP
jgi:hypothetical protein